MLGCNVVVAESTDADENSPLINESKDLSAATTNINTGDDTTVYERPYNRWYLYLKTGILIYAWFVMGFSDMLLSACLLDLKSLFKVSYQQLSTAIAFRSVGMVAGSLLSAIFGDKLRRHSDLLLAFAFLILGSCLAGTVYSPSITVATIAIVGIGMSYNITNGLGFPMCTSLWGKSSASPLQVMMAAHSVGQLMSPIVSSPFLSKDNSQDHVESKSYVQIPFLISAGSCILCVVVFVCFHIKEIHQSRQQTEIGDSKSFWQYLREEKQKGNLCYVITIIILLPLAFVFSSSRDVSTSRYLLSLAVDSGLFIKSDAIIVLLTYNLSGMVCRFVAALVLKYVPLKYVLFIPAFAAAGFIGALYCVGFDSPVYFWVLICCAVFFYRTYRGSMIAWLNTNITFSPFVMSVSDLGIGAGSSAFNWLCGYYLDTCGPKCVVLACYVAACSLCAITMFMQLILSFKNRFK